MFGFLRRIGEKIDKITVKEAVKAYEGFGELLHDFETDKADDLQEIVDDIEKMSRHAGSR